MIITKLKSYVLKNNKSLILSKTIIREIYVQKFKLHDRFNAFTLNFTVDEITVRLCVLISIYR